MEAGGPASTSGLSQTKSASCTRLPTALEVGAASESITITEAASLLKTESGKLSHNVSSQRQDDLPVLSIGSAAGTQ